MPRKQFYRLCQPFLTPKSGGLHLLFNSFQNFDGGSAGRCVKIYEREAEALPFPDRSFDGILMVLTLCFVADATQALSECRRVLHAEGRLLLGVIPADSLRGSEYREKASKGHPVYALAHFRTATEIVGLAEEASFALLDAASTLFWTPGDAPPTELRVKTGIV